MKRVLCIITILVLCLALLVGCTTPATPTTPSTPDEEVTDGQVPFASFFPQQPYNADTEIILQDQSLSSVWMFQLRVEDNRLYLGNTEYVDATTHVDVQFGEGLSALGNKLNGGEAHFLPHLDYDDIVVIASLQEQTRYAAVVRADGLYTDQHIVIIMQVDDRVYLCKTHSGLVLSINAVK